jgi:hypothetical protein
MAIGRICDAAQQNLKENKTNSKERSLLVYHQERNGVRRALKKLKKKKKKKKKKKSLF